MKEFLRKLSENSNKIMLGIYLLTLFFGLLKEQGYFMAIVLTIILCFCIAIYKKL